MTPLPRELQGAEGSLRAHRWTGAISGHSVREQLPRLRILSPRKVGLRPQQFKAPTDSRQRHPLGLQKEEDLRWGRGGRGHPGRQLTRCTFQGISLRPGEGPPLPQGPLRG